MNKLLICFGLLVVCVGVLALPYGEGGSRNSLGQDGHGQRYGVSGGTDGSKTSGYGGSSGYGDGQGGGQGDGYGSGRAGFGIGQRGFGGDKGRTVI